MIVFMVMAKAVIDGDAVPWSDRYLSSIASGCTKCQSAGMVMRTLEVQRTIGLSLTVAERQRLVLASNSSCAVVPHPIGL